MRARFWLERWQSDRIGFHQAEVNPHLQKHWGRMEVAPGGTVFVPLCGKSLDLLWLAEQGFQVLGNELSEVAVRAFFDEHGLRASSSSRGSLQCWSAGAIELWCGDFFALRSEDLNAVAAVYDRAALVAFPADMRIRYAEHMQRILPAQAEMLLITLEYPQQDMEGPPFSVDIEEVESSYGKNFRIERIHSYAALPDNPQFVARGLNELEEAVYRLRPRVASL